MHTLHSMQIRAPTHASSLPQRLRHKRRRAGLVLKNGLCRTAVPGAPKHTEQAFKPAIKGWPGMVPADAPHSPKRSSTVHTSARRPPGAGEARSGALQERPARRSRACTYSRPSALAWATSSLSVGDRSKASMISAAKTEERRSTSMVEAQAKGATPANRQSAEGSPPARWRRDARHARRPGGTARGTAVPTACAPVAPGADPNLTGGRLGAALKKGRLVTASRFTPQAF